MEQKLNKVGTVEEGKRGASETQYSSLVETLLTLLQAGMISLPRLSKQWTQDIMEALQGKPWILKKAYQRFHKTLDPLLELKQSNQIVEKWKLSEIEYLVKVGQILNFFHFITEMAEKERKHNSKESSHAE